LSDLDEVFDNLESLSSSRRASPQVFVVSDSSDSEAELDRGGLRSLWSLTRPTRRPMPGPGPSGAILLARPSFRRRPTRGATPGSFFFPLTSISSINRV
jgi:hypothetical protein